MYHLELNSARIAQTVAQEVVRLTKSRRRGFSRAAVSALIQRFDQRNFSGVLMLHARQKQVQQVSSYYDVRCFYGV